MAAVDDPPSVVVCIPSYNQASFIESAVASAVAQHVPGLAIFVFDDHSRDGTSERAAQLGGPVKVIPSATNLGMVANWNRCVRETDAEFVCFLCGDDELAPGFLLAALQVARRHPEVVMVSGQMEIIDEHGSTQGERRPWTNSFIAPGSGVIHEAVRRGGGNLIGNPTGVLLRRSAIPTFDASYRQLPDWDCWLRMLAKGSLAYLDIPACRYRLHGQQESIVNGKQRAVDTELEGLLVLQALLRWPNLAPRTRRLVRRTLARESWLSFARIILRARPRRRAFEALRLQGPLVTALGAPGAIGKVVLRRLSPVRLTRPAGSTPLDPIPLER